MPNTNVLPANAVLGGSGSVRPAARVSAAAGRVLAIALWSGLAVGAVSATASSTLDSSPHAAATVIGLLTLFVAATVVSFSRRYMRADSSPAHYFGQVALLVASVLVLLFAGDLVTLAAGWCASGVLLARLIGHDRGWHDAQQAARCALGAFAIGDAALLSALAMLGLASGSWRIDAVLAAVPSLPAEVSWPAAGLLLIAAMARCALPPFSRWLLSSMTAPTPVSALMHAGLVNAGGFLLIRFAPLFEAAAPVRATAVGAGLVGAIYGVGVMSVRPDIKRSLAGSTVSQMGFMIMSCGLGAYAAALWHIVAHGLFKAWLFLGSGSSVGVRADKTRTIGSPALVSAIALMTLAAGAWLIFGAEQSVGSNSAAGLVPLLLGLATALATMAAGLRSELAPLARLGMALLILILIGFHAAGLGAMQSWLGPDGGALLSSWALLALLSAFLGGWVWQQWRQSAPLPPALYIHLLNAGSAPAARES